jgi:hypothetical protein
MRQARQTSMVGGRGPRHGGPVPAVAGMALRLALLAIVSWSMSALAQTKSIGPGGILMAPGPSQPHDFTPGGTGAGGVSVAPGRAARDADIERIGPGDTAVAPGPAGRVRAGPTARTQPLVPSSGGLAVTIKAKHRHHRRIRHHVPE